MGRREGLVTVMLMQFVPPPPTVHQEYTNMMVKIMLTMMIMSLGRNDLHFYLGTAQISIITFRKRKVSLQERKKDIFRNKSTMSSTPPPPRPHSPPPLIVLWQFRFPKGCLKCLGPNSGWLQSSQTTNQSTCSRSRMELTIKSI